MRKHNPGTLSYIFKTMKEHADMEGYDVNNARQVSLEKAVQRPDIMLLGPPCQPFSQLRGDRFETNCEDHRLFGATFGGDEGSVVEVLQSLMPRVAVVEQVLGFTRADPVSGISPISVFLRKVRDMKTGDSQLLYPVCHVFDMDPKAWLKIARPRTVRAWVGVGRSDTQYLITKPKPRKSRL
jgi:site-specific DNA-cytosine methylase